MRSSTFVSRDTRIISGALASAMALVFVYHVLVVSGLVEPASPQTAPGRARLRMEDYLVSHRKPIVAVGSSILDIVLSAPESDPRIFNLCIGGLSAIDGIETLEQSGEPPEVILIEMSNIILQKESKHLAKEVLSPWRRFLLRLSPIFHVQFTPVEVLSSSIHCVGDMIGRRFSNQSPSDTYVARQLSAINYANEQAPLTQENRQILRQNLEAIKDFVARAKQKGSKVIFVRVPQDDKLVRTEAQMARRQIMNDFFPKTTYSWIESESRDWRTTDGVHLVPEEAVRFKQELLQMLSIAR